MAVQFHGSAVRINRGGLVIPVVVTNSISTTTAFDLMNASVISIYSPTGGPTGVTPYGAADELNTLFAYKTFVDDDGNPVLWTFTVNVWNIFTLHPIAMPWTKLVLTAGTTGTVYVYVCG